MRSKIEKMFFKNGVYDRRATRSHPDLVAAIRQELGSSSETVTEDVYRFMNSENPPQCVCGKSVKFISYSKGYRKFCSAACMGADAIVKQKRVLSIEKTCLEKYGVANVFGDVTVRAKATDTILARYGVSNIAQSASHREEMKKTCQSKWGVDHPFQANEVKEKSKQTMLSKYQAPFTLCSPELSGQMRETMQERYGAKTSWQSPLLITKLHNWQKERFLKSLTNRGFEILNPTTLEVKHCCGAISSMKWFSHIKCQACKITSRPEQELYEFLSQYTNVSRNDRKIIGPRELDIVLPDFKLAIEMNGAYWHHAETPKLPLIEKNKLAELSGYRVIHIWDYEWTDNREVIESLLLAQIGKFNRRVAARDNVVKSIDKITAQVFLDKYHLQKSCKASMALGLFCNDELLGVATFGRSRFSKLGESELLRLCFVPGVQIVGGVGKLVAYASRQLRHDIMTYADARFSIGKGYLAAGFVSDGQSAPGYCWFSNRTGPINRYLTQKRRISEIVKDADLSKTEDAIMQSAGFLKLIDCGHHRFLFKFLK